MPYEMSGWNSFYAHSYLHLVMLMSTVVDKKKRSIFRNAVDNTLDGMAVQFAAKLWDLPTNRRLSRTLRYFIQPYVSFNHELVRFHVSSQ